MLQQSANHGVYRHKFGRYLKHTKMPKILGRIVFLPRPYWHHKTPVSGIAGLPAPYLGLAEQARLRAEYAAALELLGDPEKDHLPPPAYIAIGDALFRRGQLMQATQAYKNSLTLYPDDMLSGLGPDLVWGNPSWR